MEESPTNCTVLYRNTLYCTELHCTVFHYTKLHSLFVLQCLVCVTIPSVCVTQSCECVDLPCVCVTLPCVCATLPCVCVWSREGREEGRGGEEKGGQCEKWSKEM